MSLPRVLVLDGQTNQALACVRSLGRAGYEVLVAGRGRRPLAAWSRWSAAHRRLDGESTGEFAALRAWAAGRRAAIVLPMTERSCLLCNAERDAWTAAGIRVGCAEADVMLGAFDKVRTLEAAEAAGVSIPPTRLGSSAAEYAAHAEALGFPCVLKTRFSEALVDGRLLRGGGADYVAGPSELPAAVQRNRQGPHWPILQKYVAGTGRGVSGLCDRGRPVALYAHERLRDVRPSGSGSSLRRSIPLEPRLREPVERLLRRLAWHGPVMVEFRDDGGPSPCLMEVNGRFWGSTQLAVEVGMDVPRAWVELLQGQRVEAITDYPSGVTLRWLWGDVKRLLTILQGPPPGYPGRYPTRLQGIAELFQPQPPGTRLEAWRRDDPAPALGEWVQGIGELLTLGLARRWPAPHPAAGVPRLELGIHRK
ncbi:MAG TPA: ATP-grasp domain-containing protein [Gemmatimonadales bacterium]